MNSKLHNPLIHFAFYFSGLALFYLTSKFSPTGLAGPGLDLVVLFIMFLSIIYFLMKVWFKLKIRLSQKIVISIIHLIGIGIILLIVNLPQ